MKICPQCRTAYADDTLRFCLQDGSQLVGYENQISRMPTQSFSEEETVMARNQLTREPSLVTRIAGVQPQVNKSNTATTIMLTGLIMTLFFSVLGIGAWIYFRNAKPDIRQNTNSTPNLPTNNSNIKSSPAPTASVKSSPGNVTISNVNSTDVFKKTPSVTPTPEFDSEQVKGEVSNKIYNWKNGLESGSLNSVMSNYADRLDYYFNKGGVGAGAVRADKQRAFNLFNSFRVNLSNMRVVPDATGERATAVFDKEWVFTGAKTNAGKVQTQLQFTKINGQWRITGEKDLKVYYVDKSH